MKAILKFNLDDTSDKLAHNRAVKATSAYLTLYELDQYLRQETKYADDAVSDETVEALERVRETLFNLLSTNGVDLDDLE